MNMKYNNSKYKSRAQTMVEFALVLPILMLLVFGLLEVGRLVFVYISISSASREAVRYGSATGQNLDSTKLLYLDCEGIRAAARKVDYLNVISGITITYDHGPSGPAWDTSKFGSSTCDGTNTTLINDCEPGSKPLVCYTDRIKVEVTGNFTPIVNFIPLSSRPIISTNYHTLLGIVEIDSSTGTPFATRTLIPTITLLPTATSLTAPTATNTPTVGPSPTPGCIYTVDNPVISSDYTSISWTIQNGNAFALVIKSISVSWPAGSGVLESITIDSDIFNLNLLPPTQTILSISKPLDPGEHTFKFKFRNNPLSGLFQVSLGFSNDKCAVSQRALTVYPVTHSGTIPDAAPITLVTGGWTLVNHTDQNINIASIEVTFPCANKNDIIGINFANQNWFGAGYVSSCHGTIITPINMIIPPGPSIMYFTFDSKKTTAITGISAKVTLQCYGVGVTTTCQTVDSNNAAQITTP